MLKAQYFYFIYRKFSAVCILKEENKSVSAEVEKYLSFRYN